MGTWQNVAQIVKKHMFVTKSMELLKFESLKWYTYALFQSLIEYSILSWGHILKEFFPSKEESCWMFLLRKILDNIFVSISILYFHLSVFNIFKSKQLTIQSCIKYSPIQNPLGWQLPRII